MGDAALAASPFLKNFLKKIKKTFTNRHKVVRINPIVQKNKRFVQIRRKILCVEL